MPDSPDKGIDLTTAIAAKASRELSQAAKDALTPRAAAGAVPRLAEVLTRADALRTFEKDHPQDPAEVLRQAGKMGARGLSQQEFGVLRNNLKPDAAANPPAIITELDKFTLYAEVLQKSRETGLDGAQVVANDPTLRDELTRLHTDWDGLSGGVLNGLLYTETIRTIMPPEFYGIRDEAIKREIIQILIASDPRLREAVIEKIRGVVTLAESIPVPLTATERATLEGERNALDAKITAMGDSLAMVPGLTPNRINAYTDGRTFEQAVRALERDLLVHGGIGVAHQGDLLALNIEVTSKKEAKRILDEKQIATAKLEALQAAYLQRGANLSVTQQAALDTLTAERDVAGQNLTQAQGRVDQIAQRFNKTEAEIEAIVQSVKRTIHGGEGVLGVREPGLRDTLEELVRTAGERREKENKINHPPPLTAEKQRERITQQNDLTARLENVMAEAISEVLLKRYEDSVKLNSRKTEANAREAAKKGEEDKAKGLRLIEEAKDTRWVKFDKDKRKFTTDKPQIETDMRYLAARGEEGLKRLFLRELTETGRAVITLPLRPAGGGVGARYTYDSMPLDELTPEQKTLLDSIFTQEKDRYLEKLFGDYYASRLGVGGLLGSLAKDIKLSDAEFVRLDQSFGERFQQKVGSSKEAVRTMKRLRESGVNINILGPLWYMLLAILLGGK